jgi:hypothetical protein
MQMGMFDKAGSSSADISGEAVHEEYWAITG